MMRRSPFFMVFAVIALTGCGGAGTSTGAPAKTGLSSLQGSVHGGQNPIAYSSLQVYQAGTSGTYGTGAKALIPAGSYFAGGMPGCVASPTQQCYANVVSDANGHFDITGDYTCTSGTNLYITATGGNPGSGINNSLTLVAGFGLCDNLANVTFIVLNEITTIGTVWALAPFMTDTYNAATQTSTINIGGPSTNVTGLNQAFADINTLINYQTGYAPGPAPGSGATLPAGANVPVKEIFALADSLAACVNTNGGSICNTLFGYTTVNGVAPTDTVGAALNIANYPGVNASQILQLGFPQSPWPTTFLTANDLTLAVTYTGDGINAPSALAVDATGNVWIANAGGNSVAELAHNGTPVGASPFTSGLINAPSAIAIDTAGDVWVANGNSTLTELNNSGANVNNSPFSGGGLSRPSSISFDAQGNIWLANYLNNSLSEFSATGTAISPSTGFTATALTSPVAVAINVH